MTRPESTFDFRNPDYGPILQARMDRLAAIRQDPALLAALKVHYASNPWDFVTDWGMTWAPKAKEPPILRPFIMFPKQVEWMKWVVDLLDNHKRGLTEKSRESGVTWLSVALACTLCLFRRDMTIGFGANLAGLVDELGDLDSILEKARMFMDYLPVEFNGGWDRTIHTKKMLLKFPETNSIIKGQGGDQIGRGGRASMWFVDEFAHIEHADMIDAALMANTDTQIDISTVRGSGNAFAVKNKLNAVMHQTFAVHTLRHAGLPQERDGPTLEDPCPDAPQHILWRLTFNDECADPRLMQQLT